MDVHSLSNEISRCSQYQMTCIRSIVKRRYIELSNRLKLKLANGIHRRNIWNDKRDAYISVKNELTKEKVPVTKHKEPILSKTQKNGMNHIKKIDKKENKSATKNFNRRKNKQLAPVFSLKKEKGLRAVVKFSTKNKELIREIVKLWFEQNKSISSERSVAISNISCTPDGIFSVFLTPLTYAGNDLDLSNYINRLCTFCDWPQDVGVYAINLAKAGFYYVQRKTTVECFSCGLTVSDWKPEDDPLTRHKELSPLCVFINSSTTASAIEGSEHLLDFQALNREINTNAISKPRENVHQPSSPENAAINFENLNNKILKCSSDTTVIKKDTSEKHQNHERNCMGTQKDDYTSGRGLPINQPVDVTSSQEIRNVYLCLSTNNSNQNIPESTIFQESERNNNNISKEDYNQFVNFAQNIPESTIFQESERNNNNISEEVYNQLVNFAIAKHPHYANPKRRLETFRSWLYHNVQHPQQLVEAGFYYTDSTDVVRCFHCDIGLAEWDVQDDPWVEHARHSPQCFFLREKRGTAFVDNVQQFWREIYTPKCPQFEDFRIRQSTYQGWPSDRDQSPRELAAAGFYYTGEDDTVRCHYCDGGLRQWEPGDNPWVEHARWFPFCKYVVKMKGFHFIEEVARTYNDLYVNSTQDQMPSAEVEAEDGGACAMDGYENDNTLNNERRNALTMAASVSVLEMGYKKPTLIMAINKYLKRTDNRDFTTEDLIDVIHETNEDELPKDDDETDCSSSELGIE
ncbi:hypothetical protein KUTeg_006766 [Tegillarca granosa]|uniref:Uncharacterized protein n=1 Tax=Tegillarca granosa TaxID=220873 RepID=A0ABQ9FBB2_TEGGR|nr:hypothetical protein KUTeg_006766 [Tegillarca granosa]